MELLIALLLGIPAFVSALRTRPLSRMRRASVVCLSLWAATGIVLFSDMTRLHPRYVEGFMPAVAALLGIGVAWAASGSGRAQVVALVVALAAAVFYAERLLYGRPGVWWLALAAALGAIVLAALARLGPGAELAAGEGAEAADATPRQVVDPPQGRPAGGSWRAPLLSGAVMALTLVAVLAIPLRADVSAISNHVTDAGYVGALPGEEQRPLSAYLRAHQGSARDEVAAESATQIGSLIVADGRPILILTTYEGRVFTSVAKLKALIAAGQVRYAFLNSYCPHHPSPDNAACSAPAIWIRVHGTDVSRQAGLPRDKVLWLLPGARA
jgi:hypothetical protein